MRISWKNIIVQKKSHETYSNYNKEFLNTLASYPFTYYSTVYYKNMYILVISFSHERSFIKAPYLYSFRLKKNTLRILTSPILFNLYSNFLLLQSRSVRSLIFTDASFCISGHNDFRML